MAGGTGGQQLAGRLAARPERVIRRVGLGRRVRVGGVVVRQAEGGIGAAEPVGDVLARRGRVGGAVLARDHGGPAAQQALRLELQERGGAAVDERGRGGRQHGRGRAGPLGGIGRLEDLHGRVGRRDRLYLQGGPHAGRDGRDRLAEGRDPGEAGGLQRGVHQRGRRIADLGGIQVVADQDVPDPGPGQVGGETGRGRSRFDRVLGAGHEVAGAAAGVGHQVGLHPRRAGQRLQGLVDRLPPGVDPVRVGRDDHGGFGPVMGAQPGGRLLPVGRDLGERAGLQRLPVQERQRQTGQRRDAGHRADDAGGAPSPHGPGQGVRDPQRQHRGDHRLDLEDVAQRRQRTVQQLLDRPVQRAAERPAVAGQPPQGGHGDGAAQPQCLRQVTPGQAAQAGGGGHRDGPHRPHRAHDHRCGVEPRHPEVQVGDPVAAAAQHRRRRHGLRGVRGLLDVGQEVEAVLALVQQRHEPPQRGQQDRRRPPGGQLPSAPPRTRQHVNPGQHQRGQGRRRVDAAHAGHEQGRDGRGPPGRADVDQRQHGPRGQHAGQYGRGGRADQDGEGRPQRERGPGQQPGRARSDAERLRQPDDAQERHRHQQGHPEPFGHPHRHMQRVRRQVEQAHREGVADVLVLQAAQPLQRIPQVPEPLVETYRVDVDAQLRVERHPPRVLNQQGSQRQAPQQRGPLAAGPFGGVGPAVPQPLEPPLAAAFRARRGPGDLLLGELKRRHACRRRMTSRFQVSSSRSPGISTRNLHQRG